MKNLVTAILAALPGMLLGFVLWTAFAMFMLAVYWIGYEGLFLGIVCAPGHGRGFGLGWCDPPGAEVQEATRHYAMLLTAIAFTWGEAFAVVLGGFFGGTAGLVLMRLFAWVWRVIGRRRSEQGDQAKLNRPTP